MDKNNCYFSSVDVIACCPLLIYPIWHFTCLNVTLSFTCLQYLLMPPARRLQLMDKSFSVHVQDISQHLQTIIVFLLLRLSFFMSHLCITCLLALFFFLVLILPVIYLYYFSILFRFRFHVKKFGNENEWLSSHSGHSYVMLMESNSKLDSSQVLTIIKRVLYEIWMQSTINFIFPEFKRCSDAWCDSTKCSEHTARSNI